MYAGRWHAGAWAVVVVGSHVDVHLVPKHACVETSRASMIRNRRVPSFLNFAQQHNTVDAGGQARDVVLQAVTMRLKSCVLSRLQMLAEIGAAYLLQQIPGDRLHSVQTYCSFPGKIELSYGTWATLLANLKPSMAAVCSRSMARCVDSCQLELARRCAMSDVDHCDLSTPIPLALVFHPMPTCSRRRVGPLTSPAARPASP
jgi:hypothetical protein